MRDEWMEGVRWEGSEEGRGGRLVSEWNVGIMTLTAAAYSSRAVLWDTTGAETLRGFDPWTSSVVSTI